MTNSRIKRCKANEIYHALGRRLIAALCWRNATLRLFLHQVLWIGLISSWAMVAAQSKGLSPEYTAKFDSAVSAHQAGNLAAAADDYHAVLNAYPDFGPALLNLGLVEFAEHHPEKALSLLNRAKTLLPQSEPAWVFAGLSSYQMGDFQAAITPLTHALQLNPRDTKAMLFLGQAYNSLQRFRDAETILEEAHDLAPKDTEVLYALSQSYLQLALKTSADLRAVDPHGARVYQMAGEMFSENQNYDAAITEFKELVRRYPRFPGGHALLGEAYEDAGKNVEALAEYKRELEVNAFNSRIYARAGNLLMQAGEERQAVTYLKKALQLDPGSELATVVYGKYLVKQRQSKEAFALLQRGVGLHPNNKNVHFLLAQVYLQLGKPQEAAHERGIFEELDQKQQSQKERGPTAFTGGQGSTAEH